jgi:GT2 family glycosyltransferase
VKIAVVSAAIGECDPQPQHVQQDIPVDFFYFTDYNFPERACTMTSRLQVKILRMLGWDFVPGYDAYIWLDSTVALKQPDAVRWLVEQLGENDIALFAHPNRTTVASEGRFVLDGIAKGDPYLMARYAGEPIQQQLARYRDFPDDKLWWTGAYVYRNTPAVQTAMREWLLHCVQWSILCQISLPYVAWKTGLRVVTLPGSGFSNTRIVYSNAAAVARDKPRAAALAAAYGRSCTNVSDINEHLPTLARYAALCKRVTEFGVRTAVSTTALLYAQPEVLTSHDIKPSAEASALEPSKGKTDFKFIVSDTLKTTIAPTDMLFIDTLHTYAQLKAELALHAGKVSKYIVLHDTTTFGELSEDGTTPGLWQAVEEFVAEGEFRVAERYTNNNGLTILERIRRNVTLVIPTLTAEGADRTVELIRAALSGTVKPARVFVIDNGKNIMPPGFCVPIMDGPEVEVFRPPTPLSVSASWNEAFRRFGDWIIVANDDVEIGPDTIAEFVRAAESTPKPLITSNIGQGFPMFLLKQQAFRDVGPFDEQFAPAYYEDTDYLHRLHKAGLGVVRIDAGVRHGPGGTSAKEAGLDLEAILAANLARYVAKWGGPPGREAQPASAPQRWSREQEVARLERRRAVRMSRKS